MVLARQNGGCGVAARVFAVGRSACALMVYSHFLQLMAMFPSGIYQDRTV